MLKLGTRHKSTGVGRAIDESSQCSECTVGLESRVGAENCSNLERSTKKQNGAEECSRCECNTEAERGTGLLKFRE